jgi:phospholipid/cholesterol/gamma-HCH transport system substrate-binding protein
VNGHTAHAGGADFTGPFLSTEGAIPSGANRPAPRRSSLARFTALAALIAAAVLVALLMFGADGGYKVSAAFQNAGQLVKGNQVRIGGRTVGTIDDIRLDDSSQAIVEMTIDDDDLTPLNEGTTATIRVTSLSGIANRFVALSPGPNDAEEIADGGRIDADETSAPVDLDQLFNTFDPKTRRGLQKLIRGQATYIGGRAPEARKALEYLSPALSSTSQLTRELVYDDAAFERFVVDTSRVMDTIAQRRDDLSSLVANTSATTGAIGDESASLRRALDGLPTSLRKANTTFVNLRSTLDDLDPLVAESKPATRRLAPLLARLRPLVADARPTIGDLRTVIRTPGADNDLIELMAKLPRLEQLTSVVFPRAIRTMNRSQDFVDTLRQYTPDLAGWFTKFGQSAAAYDANGHYARIQPIFSPFSVNDATGLLTPVTPAQRLDGFEHRQFRRCPGGAMQPPPDGSAPIPVPGCDPSTTPPPP